MYRQSSNAVYGQVRLFSLFTWPLSSPMGRRTANPMAYVAISGEPEGPRQSVTRLCQHPEP